MVVTNLCEIAWQFEMVILHLEGFWINLEFFEMLLVSRDSLRYFLSIVVL